MIKAMRDYAALLAKAKQNGHFAVGARPSIALTPSVFGKLFVAAWAARNGRSELPKRDDVIKEFLSGADEAPDEVRGVMHIDEQVDGEKTIVEYTDYMVAAQSDRLIRRYNPDYIRTSVEIDSLTGTRLKEALSNGKKDVVAWVENLVNSLTHTCGPP